MIDPKACISRKKHCLLLGISRLRWYDKSKGEHGENQDLMRRIDSSSWRHLTYGSRKMMHHWHHRGCGVRRHRVRRLMRLMGLEATCQKPRTSIPHPQHRKYLYWFKDLRVTRLQQVWWTDSTSIPIPRGFLYLTAIMDGPGRKILSFRRSSAMDVSFCLEALEKAIER